MHSNLCLARMQYNMLMVFNLTYSLYGEMKKWVARTGKRHRSHDYDYGLQGWSEDMGHMDGVETWVSWLGLRYGSHGWGGDMGHMDGVEIWFT